MHVFTTNNDLQAHLEIERKKGKSVGFVPTMGALHAGHGSLIQAAKSQKDYVVCSIFVNPTQFNNALDLEKYPRTLSADIELLETMGCDALFCPSQTEMYPQGNQTDLIEFGALETVMEGAHRPGHFAGVATIVKKLLEVVQPHNLYMGQKDGQQCAIVAALLQKTGLDSTIKLVVCPTIRQANGLAMSSRNTRLNTQEAQDALAIYKSLVFAQKHYQNYTVSQMTEILELHFGCYASLKLEYVCFADAQSLQPVQAWADAAQVSLFVACFVGATRLIDNVRIF